MSPEESRTIASYEEAARRAISRPLSQEQVDRVALAAQSGKDYAAEMLMESIMGTLLGTVMRTVKGKVFSQHRKEELIQSAALAVHDALRTWDQERGHFRTYAISCARFAIYNELSNGVGVVPVAMRADLRRAALDVLKGRATFDEAACRNGVTETTLGHAIEAHRAQYVSKDIELSQDESLDMDIEDEGDDVFSESEESLREAALMHELNRRFSPEERRMLCEKHGLFGCEQRPVMEMAREKGINREAMYRRIARLESRLKVAMSKHVLIKQEEAA